MPVLGLAIGDLSDPRPQAEETKSINIVQWKTKCLRVGLTEDSQNLSVGEMIGHQKRPIIN